MLFRGRYRQLGEYRESVGVDFLCATTDGYRALRAAVFTGALTAIATKPLKLLRDLRADQYGVRTFIEIDGVPIKFEIVREARIELAGATSPSSLGVPLLSREDLFAEKLLANADRSSGRATFNRDAIDLGMMVAHGGPIPAAALRKARRAYGPPIDAALRSSLSKLQDEAWLKECSQAMQMSQADGHRALTALQSLEQLPET